MARPKGSPNGGLRNLINTKAKELLLMAKSKNIGATALKASAMAYQRLLNKAIRHASPEDSIALQKIGCGLAALAKVLKTLETIQSTDADKAHVFYPID